MHICSLSMYGCLLFESNKRQNGWTDRAQILCGAWYDPREGLRMLRITKKYFVKIIHEIRIVNPQTFFYCTKRRCSDIKPQLKVETRDGHETPWKSST